MKAVVLMTHLSDYMLNCLRTWQERSDVELHVVRFRTDDLEAPFEFSDGLGKISFYEREFLDAAKVNHLIKSLRPQLIICSGWAYKDYLRAVRNRPQGTIAVMMMDTQWHGTLRQALGAVWARITLRRWFDFVWVPGPRQHRFACVLGFSEAQIRDGLFPPNAANFVPIREGLAGGAPLKRLVFVGRYLELKGLRELWQGFIAYHDKVESDLKLLCIGTGPLEAERPDHPKIRHLGFVQPKEFPEVLKGGGILILPSHFDAWGLVVHEFALAGFPLVLSRKVGAADCFLDHDNGLILDTITPEVITEAVAVIDSLDPATLASMSRASAAKAATSSVEAWCAQADAFVAAGESGRTS